MANNSSVLVTNWFADRTIVFATLVRRTMPGPLGDVTYIAYTCKTNNYPCFRNFTKCLFVEMTFVHDYDDTFFSWKCSICTFKSRVKLYFLIELSVFYIIVVSIWVVALVSIKFTSRILYLMVSMIIIPSCIFYSAKAIIVLFSLP